MDSRAKLNQEPTRPSTMLAPLVILLLICTRVVLEKKGLKQIAEPNPIELINWEWEALDGIFEYQKKIVRKTDLYRI